MATVQQQTTQLEFHQAMADFKTMFPDMDDEVIEAVLRANQGAVDATIDQLLAMTTDNENEKLRNEMEQKETLTVIPPVGASAETKSQETSPSRSPHRSPQIQNPEVAMRTVRGWAPPLLGPLPDDFLRLAPSPWGVTQKKQAMVINQQLLQQKYAENQRVRGVLCEVGDPELDRYLEDERIALFLQNEEFMAELRWNKDFLSTLEKDQAEESPPEETLASFPLSKTLSGSHDEDALFKERLRNMGKMSRKKFAQLARVFTRRKKRSSAKNILSQGPAPSRDNLLLNAEPLLDDDDDEDDNVPDSYDTVRRPEHRE
ncbi:CUE domain-containing protein 1 [Zootermopsis nevadensis]|uniref:CUE domain-containing protein 1 n=1 Tax=Zootermopsis nevadensis TaxID=136037 RepID=A0A067R0L9_ZOONE|nr:CUE domain-containing protein 1 [Zootermopsis nevadensis]XP_021927589.1 CUE domain-containing protein 1 [Zootermopsis nevadensis]XP_021927590.1 CUE domain-containing protein 1 [Zootermopsis nevadensis]KDR15443.1 CUE domain-containing protein 1 [Zootermopsis nevadensis]